jgi:hypothetical protein
MILLTKPPSQSPVGSIPLFVWFVPAAMLLIAILRLPYGYYQLLRLVVALFAGFIVWRLWKASASLPVWALPFGALVLIFNPVFPIHAARSIWSVLNLIAAGIFAAGGVIGWRARRSQSV